MTSVKLDEDITSSLAKFVASDVGLLNAVDSRWGILDSNPKPAVGKLLALFAKANGWVQVLSSEPHVIGGVPIEAEFYSVTGGAHVMLAPSTATGALSLGVGIVRERLRATVEKTMTEVTQAVTRSDILRRIDDFEHLTGDWAGPESVAPDSVTRGAARSLIKQLPLYVPMPHVTPSGDGCISFEWETAAAYIAAEFQSGGMLVWIEKRRGQLVDGEEISWGGKLSDKLERALIRSFS